MSECAKASPDFKAWSHSVVDLVAKSDDLGVLALLLPVLLVKWIRDLLTNESGDEA